MSVITRRGFVPAYVQIAEALRSRIMSGQLAPGDPIPGELRLVQEYSVGRETVRRGLAMLRGEGLIAPIKGMGWFVRTPGQRRPITLAVGERAYPRMPTPEERESLDLDEGIPILVVERPGREMELLRGDEVEIVGSEPV